ncbi:hypothetical protein [Salmonella enterica]|uniref:hypothetical protein n=1 Tax=Salmonella enterica TaxID=28901 RepID=UPI002491BA83|nr:hypothetical protein [Salmonella enterica]HDH3839982.1 hypothetical protein [Salmonella enterica subsp. enterica serovar Oranienburg]
MPALPKGHETHHHALMLDIFCDTACNLHCTRQHIYLLCFSSPYPLSLPADAGEMLWSVWAVTSRTSQGFFTFTHSCLPHPKTFQLRAIAALPEPAGRPTHGLLSRRSTDRISTSPLANFAQLSMFRFDELIIAMSIVYSNTY